MTRYAALGGDRARGCCVAVRDRARQRADRLRVAELVRHAARVEHEHVLAGDERVEREPVGDVARAVDDRVPEALVLRVARLRLGRRGERLRARHDRGAQCGVRALGAAARRVGADAGAQLERGALRLELGRHLALRRERQQQVEPAVAAPVAHARGTAVADPDQARLLQPLERLAHGVTARAELLAQPPLGRHGGAGRQRAGEDLGPQAGVDAIGEKHWLDQLGELVVPDSPGILQAE